MLFVNDNPWAEREEEGGIIRLLIRAQRTY